MAQAVFNFPYHLYETVYPTEGNNLTLGNSWNYNSKPTSPPQRQFELSFELLKYFQGVNGVDKLTQPEINLGALEDFYQAHKLHTAFIYPHPVYGNVSVKFSKPLVIPKGIKGGMGAVAGVSVHLIEVPA